MAKSSRSRSQSRSPKEKSRLSKSSPKSIDDGGKSSRNKGSSLEKLLSIAEAADALGVHKDTLRDWTNEGIIEAVRTPGGWRKFRPSDIERFRGEPGTFGSSGPCRVASYCRVSSHEQKSKRDLERQSDRVLAYCAKQKYELVEDFQEVGSGMSDTRPKLLRLFKLVDEGQVDRVVIEHRDRICRFNFRFLQSYFASHGAEIEWIEDTLGKSREEEMVEDILSLVSSFSARVYGRRSAANRKKEKQAC